MLKMKKYCETCDAATPEQGEAFICSFECTFCKACTASTHHYICPNCQGELVKRPTRKRSVVSVAGDQLKKKLGSLVAGAKDPVGK